MTKYKLFWVEDGEEDDEVFDTFEEADEMGRYYAACAEESAETLHLSNPGDYEYDPDEYEQPEFEVIEVDD